MAPESKSESKTESKSGTKAGIKSAVRGAKAKRSTPKARQRQAREQRTFAVRQPIPKQHQDMPGLQAEMFPQPLEISPDYRGSGKLEGKVALITGGDSGIGRAVAIHYAREGADIAFVYLSEDEDAEDACAMIEAEGRKCLVIRGDVGDADFCTECVRRVMDEFGKLDILVNNAAEQHVRETLEEITEDQLVRTFRTNIFSMFFLTEAALPHMNEDSCIVNTSSVNAYRGKEDLIDYSATKGAIVSFTRSLAKAVAERGIRVNAVAPGPIWTPLIPASFKPDEMPEFGRGTLLGRPGHPSEVAPAYVFLASAVDSSYITGQVIHPNGGDIFAS